MSRFLSISSGPRSVGSHSDIDTSDEEQDYDMEDYDADNIMCQEQPKDFSDDDGGHFRQIGYPEHVVSPVYPDHVIAALTRTSSPRRIHPQGPSYVTGRARLLRAIDTHWHTVLRRFILQDIQEDISGKHLEHIWVALNTIVIFDFEPVPALLDRLDYHNWDPLNISEQQGLFLESLARNVEWYCPKWLYGSRMREQAEASQMKPVQMPTSAFCFREKPLTYASRARIQSCPSYRRISTPNTAVTSVVHALEACRLSHRT